MLRLVQFLQELRLNLLVRLRLALELLPQPLDRRALVGHEERELRDLLHLKPTAVILCDLIREEVHAVALGELLLKARIELGRAERDCRPALDVEGDHPIEEDKRLPFGDRLRLSLQPRRKRATASDAAGRSPKPPPPSLHGA